jgi:glycosyltransferase involved in cell wall biosynthesis
MRVTHAITRLIVGGAQENTIATVLGLMGKPGCEVSLISGPTFGSEGSLEGVFDGIPGALEIVPFLVRPVRPSMDWRAVGELARRFRQNRPDIVHTHSGKAGIVGRIAAKRANVPLVIHSIHGPSFGPFQSPLANWFFRRAEQIAGRSTDHFVSVADAMTRQYLAAGIGRPEQYTTIRSGFNLQPFLAAHNDSALRQRLGLSENDFVVGKIARMFELKGHDDLFAAAPGMIARNARIKFLLVGGGPWEERFRKMAEQIGLGNHFIFAGLVPPGQVPELVGIMNCLVHLSRREGLPRALPQAMAAGKAVVAFDCDGAGEVCIEGRTGYLIAPGDLRRLEDCVVTLSMEPALAERFGAEGRRLAEAAFSVEGMVNSIYDLYLRLRGGKP